MATNGYPPVTDGAPGRHGPIPTIVYVCEPDTATAERLADLCRIHAAQRAWWVVDTVIEQTPNAPLNKREGWTRVKAALDQGAVGIVITWSPISVAPGLAEFQVLQAEFRVNEAVLVAVTGIPDPPSARRSPAD
ncbi:hypothetical protein [Streptantibioticus ferralitis]|uniref:Resolvase/invertase-type recombinase catalytic domain-containing protein n=1 Tax=Streptantibioticus ferralitis TaxID=236510 RepID=A0ABT5YWR2_9ACTN|nr:hypothetical protein [Streptantibioticus ferralitis]MDF2255879.1 hypothetical protein [Streptantibioticus ferralitis]